MYIKCPNCLNAIVLGVHHNDDEVADEGEHDDWHVEENLEHLLPLWLDPELAWWVRHVVYRELHMQLLR